MPRRPEPRWYEPRRCWSYRVRGRRRYLPGVPKSDLAAAQAWAEELEREAFEADQAVASPTVVKLCRWFLVWQASEHEPRTVAGHRFILGKFCKFAGPDGEPYANMPATRMGPTELARMAGAWTREGCSPGYLAQLYKSVLACWAWAARPEPERVDADGTPLPERLIPSNPFAGLRRPSPRSRADRYATREEVADVLRHARRQLAQDFPRDRAGRCLQCQRGGWPRHQGPCPRNHAPTSERLRDVLVMIRLAAWAGVRPGELCDARWADWRPSAMVDELGRAWGVLKVRHKNIRHTGELRAVVVPPRLARAIERIGQRGWSHPTHVFAHSRGRGGIERGADREGGEPWNTQSLGRRIALWRDGAIAEAEAAGRVPRVRPTFTCYCLRHAFYTRVSAVLGAQLAGRIGGTSERIVERVYVRRREDSLIDGMIDAEAAMRGRERTPAAVRKTRGK